MCENELEWAVDSSVPPVLYISSATILYRAIKWIDVVALIWFDSCVWMLKRESVETWKQTDMWVWESTRKR